MSLDLLLTFVVAFTIFAASPGPDNVTIIARTLSKGPLDGIAYGAGTATGVLLFLALAALGLSAIAAHASEILTVARYLGAAYLIWMGVNLWRQPAQSFEITPHAVPLSSLGRTFGLGVAMNLGNPKMPLFYLALLPNLLVDTALTGAVLASLALAVLAVEIVVIGGHVLLAYRARRLLRSPQAVRRLNRCAGGLMIGAGGVIAVRG